MDSIFKVNYHFFEPDLIKNFETPKLLKEKEELITNLKNKNEKSTLGIWWGLIVLMISLIALSYYFNKQLKYKKRFEYLMLQSTLQVEEPVKKYKLDISSDILDGIIYNLSEFEKNNKFLSKKVSLSELAHSFGTNPRYLSSVINFEKGKSFPQYINDLRVNYSLKELTENPRFRKFTIKAIASDCGFKSAESFSKAFLKKHGIYPSYFIKKVDDQNGLFN